MLLIYTYLYKIFCHYIIFIFIMNKIYITMSLDKVTSSICKWIFFLKNAPIISSFKNSGILLRCTLSTKNYEINLANEIFYLHLI